MAFICNVGMHLLNIILMSKQKSNIASINLPGHSVSSQKRLSRLKPSQFLPPYLGGGESQLLSLNCTPPPQDTLQVE